MARMVGSDARVAGSAAEFLPARLTLPALREASKKRFVDDLRVVARVLDHLG